MAGTSTQKYFNSSAYLTLIWVVLALPVIYFISRQNYNLFHSVADGLSIVIAACAFTIIWNSRRLVDNNYFLYAGIAFLFFAFLDLMHLLGNKDMGVFTQYGNLGPTFYIASRYVLSISLIIAPLFINRRLNTTLMFSVYTLGVSLILLSIFFWRSFPVCIVEGVGLTPFKVISDYIICLILLGAIGLLLINRRAFDDRVLKIIVSSLVLFIATGLTFTLYTDPFGVTNMFGHLFQIGSFYLVYLAFIETSLTKPQEILFRKLKQHEETLINNLQQLDAAHFELKQEMAERKRAETELRQSEAKYRTLFENMTEEVHFWKIVRDEVGQIKTWQLMDANPPTLKSWGRTTLDEIKGKTTDEIFGSGATNHHMPIVQKIMTEGVPYVFEDYFPHLDKHFRFASVPLGDYFFTTGADITGIKKAHAALQDSESRFRTMTNAMPQLGWIARADGFITWYNQRWYEYTGTAPEQMEGWGWQSVHDPVELPKVLERWQASIATGEPFDMTFPLLGADGVFRPFLTRVIPLKDAAGRVQQWFGTNTDVSELKRFEQALRESEALYRGIGDSIDYGVWVCAPDGRNTYASESFLKMVGITQEQCSNFGWGDALHPDDAARTIAAWQECVSTGGNMDIEHRFRGTDGKWYYVLARGVPVRNENGEIIRWVGINLDISKIKQTEQKLRESEKRLGMVLQASSIGTFEVDLHTGEGQWNEVEYELLGLKPGEAPSIPETFFQYVHPNDFEAVKAKWEDAIQFGELDVEFRILRADGQERWVAGKGRFLYDGKENNQAMRFLGVNFDITKRKQAETQVTASLAEKEVLLKEIHHRVKNNLQVISSLVSLQADNLTDEQARDELNDVRDRIRTMALVHEKLYQTSDLARLNFTDYTTSLVRSLWRSHGTLAEKARLNLELTSLELSVEAAVPCGLILNELASNALKHAFPNSSNGEVTVGLEHDAANGTVCLRVRDNGVGLPASLDWRQSRSLGLRLVQILTNQLRGTVDVGTGPGTEFQITFPSNGFQS